MRRNPPPAPRRRDLRHAVCRNQPFTITAGFYDDGTLGEVFIDNWQERRRSRRHIARDAAVVISASRFSTASASRSSGTQ